MLKPNKVLLFAGENLVAHSLLNQLIPYLKEQNLDPVVYIVRRKPSKNFMIPSIIHYGFYEYGLVKSVANNVLDSKKYRRVSGYRTHKELEERYQCLIRVLDNVNGNDFADALESENFCGALSINNPGIFAAPVIEKIKSKGFFWNLHHGKLPEYRGLFLAFWSLMEGRKTHGCTLHEIDAGIDTGRLISTYETELHRDKPIIQSYVDLVDGGAAMIINALETYLATGSVPSYEQDHSKARYYSFPTEDDIARARAQGIRLWGTPMEMLQLYRDLFGDDEELTMRLINAIAEFERGAVEPIPETAPAAQSTQAA